MGVVEYRWFFTILTITVFAFMLIVGYSSKGNIPLGTDDEALEFSTGSWIAMLFSAGMGIGLLFFGSYEPHCISPQHAPGFSNLGEPLKEKCRNRMTLP